MRPRVPLIVCAFLAAAPVARGQCQLAELVPAGAAANDQFGLAVSLFGARALVGAHLHDVAAEDAGAAYVFELGESGWSQTALLSASDAAPGDGFGRAVAVNTATALVGAWADDAWSGSLYAFVPQGSAWVESQKITASDGAALDFFGFSLAMSGRFAVVGAPGDDDRGVDAGAAYVFQNPDGSGWIQLAKLTALDGAAGDFFGYSVAIWGGTVVVGSYLDDDGASTTGSAYVFESSGGPWQQTSKLRASDAAFADTFGYSVAVEGDTAVVGARLTDRGSIDTGSVYVFEKQAPGMWVETAQLTALDAGELDEFGFSVATSAGRILVGAPYDHDAGTSDGSAYLFERSGTAWTPTGKLTGAGGHPFGIAVSLHVDRAAVGAHFDSPDTGSAQVFSAVTGCAPGTIFCTGVSCPCGNDDASAGCANSTGSGALLTGTGTNSVAADVLSLVASNCPPSNSGLFFAGDTELTPAVFVGDGLGCAGGLSYRYPPGQADSNGFFALANVVSSSPPGFIVPGVTRHFQAWTRDVLCGPPPAPCPTPCGGRSNLTNGYRVTFAP